MNKYNVIFTGRDTIIRSLISILTQADQKNIVIPNINLIILRSNTKNFFLLLISINCIE